MIRYFAITIACLPLSCVGACATSASDGSTIKQASPDLSATIKGVETRLSNKVLNTRKQAIRAARDAVTTTNDAWTLRILALGAVTTGAAYPVGKLAWIIMGYLGGKAKRKLTK